MTHYLVFHGRRLDPREAAKTLLPSDTLLVCPHCSSGMVQACEPRLTTRFPDEGDATIPRMQDRWCLDCGHRWATVLPPTFQAQVDPFR